MKLITCSVLSILLFYAATAQRPGGIIDIQSYLFAVEINDRNDSVVASATISAKFLQPGSQISLDLISLRSNGRGMRIVAVLENGNVLKYSHVNDIVNIQLPATVKVNESRIVEIRYRGIPADGLIIARNKYNQRTFFSDHWPNRARNWLPCVDHPSDKAAVEFLVTAPSHYQVVATGSLVEESNLDGGRKLTHYRELMPLPMKVAAIGVAHFAMRVEGEVKGIPVETWVYPQDREKGFHDYGMALGMLPYFINKLGPYAYKKLANVQSKTVFGGMENAGTIFYAESSVTGNRTAEVLIAHEISHQWFGNMVTETDWPHLWLSEGFVSYLAILYMEETHGEDTATKMRIDDRTKALDFAKKKSMPVVVPSTNNYLELLNANSYEKGSWVLHMLRKETGDSIFWKCLRSFYSEFAGKNADTEDFRKTCERISGKDLKQFFRQWLYTAGHPQLEVTWKYNKPAQAIQLTISQQQATPFEFPLEVKVALASGKSIVTTVYIKDKQSSLSIAIPSAPRNIELDPSADLFFEGGTKQLNN